MGGMEEVKTQIIDIDYQNKRILVKIGRMRKPDSLIVIMTDKGNIIAQGERCIIKIDPSTGKGVYNTKGSLFVHLNPLLGAKTARFSQDFINSLLEVETRQGELIGFLEGAPVFYDGIYEI